MKRLLIVLMLIGFVFGISGLALADNEATQTVTYEVTAINELEVSGNPAELVVGSATAGSEPSAAQDTSTTYLITTNCGTDAKRITAIISAGGDMPENTTLKITLAAPAGASASQQTLVSTEAKNVVENIDGVASHGHQITYDFSATVAAGVIGSAQKTVTLTLTNM